MYKYKVKLLGTRIILIQAIKMNKNYLLVP